MWVAKVPSVNMGMDQNTSWSPVLTARSLPFVGNFAQNDVPPIPPVHDHQHGLSHNHMHGHGVASERSSVPLLDLAAIA